MSLQVNAFPLQSYHHHHQAPASCTVTANGGDFYSSYQNNHQPPSSAPSSAIASRFSPYSDSRPVSSSSSGEHYSPSSSYFHGWPSSVISGTPQQRSLWSCIAANSSPSDYAFPGSMSPSLNAAASVAAAAAAGMSRCSADYAGMYVDVQRNGGRMPKRRTTANKKERRRTLSINTAFASLRGCIPNVPSDTKLSKIKTLRLATSYIAYLMEVLSKEDAKLGGFKAELNKRTESKEDKKKREAEEMLRSTSCERKSKGRTGWPQHVWASELSATTCAPTPNMPSHPDIHLLQQPVA